MHAEISQEIKNMPLQAIKCASDPYNEVKLIWREILMFVSFEDAVERERNLFVVIGMVSVKNSTHK